ncbi:S1/P1 nuclease [Aequorivita todarodis]|uniref:S1/P1 nuclease n=1 Tax=Aequorivita todarodis TaxID=2036821 RepID=UPI0023501E45|nr:S1/P1 nuclease [Aequorivita todarodis]MDC7999761.1 S1/P1 nuclease [Aequorivita todarodis]
MKKFVVVLLVFFFSIGLYAAEDWGKTGHRVVGEIAGKYLSKKAEKQISRLLDGHSLAFVANYGDDIKSDRQYDAYGPWHYVNFPFGEKYETHPKSEKGDIIQGIEKCITVLKKPNSSREDKVFHLKMLVHFLGDLHQPLHIGLADDKGGNDFQVRWFSDGTNLHAVWDYKMLDFYEMSYTELAINTDVLSKEQVEAIKKGTVIDWMYESRLLCEDIYAHTEIGEKLSYNYMYEYMDTLRFQLQKGGIRLAKLLNEIFG